jgi:hypothetical protein
VTGTAQTAEWPIASTTTERLKLSISRLLFLAPSQHGRALYSKILSSEPVHFGSNTQQLKLRLENVLENKQRSESDLGYAPHSVAQYLLIGAKDERRKRLIKEGISGHFDGAHRGVRIWMATKVDRTLVEVVENVGKLRIKCYNDLLDLADPEPLFLKLHFLRAHVSTHEDRL